jgi:WD40 repeat protein
VLLDVQRGGVVAHLRPHADTLWSLQFSPDGGRLATCSWDGSIAISDTMPLRDRLARSSPTPSK